MKKNKALSERNNSHILIKIHRDPLDGQTLDEVKTKFKNAIKGRALAGYIFGSFATGKFNRFSDLDLIIVAETKTSFIERPFDYKDVLKLGPAIDLLVYTPKEFEKLTTRPSAGFWKGVCREMKRIV